jgi:hypothetical protein
MAVKNSDSEPNNVYTNLKDKFLEDIFVSGYRNVDITANNLIQASALILAVNIAIEGILVQYYTPNSNLVNILYVLIFASVGFIVSIFLSIMQLGLPLIEVSPSMNYEQIYKIRKESIQKKYFLYKINHFSLSLGLALLFFAMLGLIYNYQTLTLNTALINQ